MKNVELTYETYKLFFDNYCIRNDISVSQQTLNNPNFWSVEQKQVCVQNRRQFIGVFACDYFLYVA